MSQHTELVELLQYWADIYHGDRAGGVMLKASATIEALSVNPLDMLLYCPKCGLQHIDAPDEPWENRQQSVGICEGQSGTTATSGSIPRERWVNPPHKSHLCRPEDGGCGCIWRPADVPTNGVASIQTVGKADTWTPTLSVNPLREAEIIERAIDRIGWPEIHAFQDTLAGGQDVYEDAGGYMIRAIKALFGIKRDPVLTYRDAARKALGEQQP